MKRWVVLAILQVIVGAVTYLHADDAVLTLPGEAKSAAMGEAYSASAAGADGLWYNPAGLSRADVPTISLMHTSYVEKITFNTVGVALPFGSQNALGIGASYLNVGSIPSFDNTGTSAPSYTPSDIVARLAFAKTLYKTSFGVSAFFLKSTIVNSASTFGGNLGFHQIMGPIFLAFVAENFGGKLQFAKESESLPSRLRTGFSLRLLPGFRLNGDVVKPVKGDFWAATGTEIKVAYSDSLDFALRGGYNTKSSDVEGLQGLSAGAGVGFSGSNLNYAWVPFGELGQTHRLSFDVQFGEQSFNPVSERDLRTQTLIKRRPKAKPASLSPGATAKAATALPVLPWKKIKSGWRTSKDKMIDLLARDALCASVGARALVTRTVGNVTLKPSGVETKWVRTRAGRYLFEGDQVRTSENASAHLVFANGVKTEIGANTHIQVKTHDNPCDQTVASLEIGNLVAISEEGKEMKIETPLGEAMVKDAQAQVIYDGKTVLMRVQRGTGTFTSEGQSVTIQSRTTFAKSSEGKTQKTSDGSSEPNIATNITPADPRKTPGRWDSNFAKTFEREMMRLDSTPGIQLSEYVRDTSLRSELKLKIVDMMARKNEMETQVEDYQRDVGEFEKIRESLRQTLARESKTAFLERKISLKQTNLALTNAQASLSAIRKELKVFLNQLRINQELLASLPIIRMLNITAQESTIPFAQGRSVVPEESQAVLDTIAESMLQMKPFRVVIEGHTDKTGSARSNDRLSKQRAEAVAQYLRKRTGMPARMFMTKGMGSSQPIEPGETPEAMAKNRRVEIWFELRGL